MFALLQVSTFDRASAPVALWLSQTLLQDLPTVIPGASILATGQNRLPKVVISMNCLNL